MLDEKRIKEAEKNVRDYIESGMLKKTTFPRRDNFYFTK